MEGHIGGAVGKVSRGTRAFMFTEQRSQDPGQNPALAWLPAPTHLLPSKSEPLDQPVLGLALGSVRPLDS